VVSYRKIAYSEQLLCHFAHEVQQRRAQRAALLDASLTPHCGVAAAHVLGGR
jgi:hypothetical protein